MKIKCDECGWRGDNSETLTAQNPFDLMEEITGCPRCKAIERLVAACDEPGCWCTVTCATSIRGGYRMSCALHAPGGKQKR